MEYQSIILGVFALTTIGVYKCVIFTDAPSVFMKKKLATLSKNATLCATAPSARPKLVERYNQLDTSALNASPHVPKSGTTLIKKGHAGKKQRMGGKI